MSWFRGDAQFGSELSHNPACGQAGHAASLDEEGSEDGHTRFVWTLKQDLSAVEAAVTQRWSNGLVEGHVNRLTMLKRQMYGRAGVELLRARLLPEPVFIGLHQT